jgi:hypothetical protein
VGCPSLPFPLYITEREEKLAVLQYHRSVSLMGAVALFLTVLIRAPDARSYYTRLRQLVLDNSKYT